MKFVDILKKSTEKDLQNLEIERYAFFDEIREKAVDGNKRAMCPKLNDNAKQIECFKKSGISGM